MRRRFLVLLGVLGLAGGAVVGVLGRPPARGPTRPPAVEKALRALDAFERRGDVAALARALADVPDRRALDAPYRDEVELVAVVAAGDDAALLRFALDGPPSPPRARALLRLATAGGVAVRVRAAERFLADYPTSWAAARVRGPR